MMMSKPKPTPTETGEQQPSNKKKTPVDAVADLERRLAELSAATPHIAPMAAAPPPPPQFAVPPPAPAAAAASSNKNALLVSPSPCSRVQR